MNGSNDPLGVNMFLGMLNMLRVRSLTLVVCGLTFSLHALADEDGNEIEDSARSTQLIRETTVAPPDYEYRPIETPAAAMRWQSDPVAELQLDDGSTIARLTRVRNLSLLTMARFRHSRFFFGVNSEGIVGFHLAGSSRDEDARFLEVARLPHLE
jgi:hypothetical protein